MNKLFMNKLIHLQPHICCYINPLYFKIVNLQPQFWDHTHYAPSIRIYDICT